ncbi:hypothetical protein BH10PSE5_BH10PSE5_01520 [soil metagenome]
MTGPRYSDLQAAPGVRPGSTPWRVADDGTVFAADGEVVCVLGHPEQDLTEEDVVHGALILRSPEMLLVLRKAKTVIADEADQRAISGLGAYYEEMASLRDAIDDVVAQAEGRA